MKDSMRDSIVSASDSYKFGHYPMYPKNTEYVYSYFESREGARFDETAFFSLQSLLMDYLVGEVVTQEKIDFANKVIDGHLGPNIFNREGWEYILKEHGGKLPLKIRAIPEGSVVSVSNVLFTVENTDPKCYWLTNFVESILSHVWYGSTVATLSREIKKLMYGYMLETGDKEVADAAIDFSCHDFGYRSASSHESAEIGGAAHLINFMGTDTVPALIFLMEMYNADIAGYSVNATEHSIMTSKAKEGEFEVVEHILNEYPEGILSMVIDSYDYRNFIKVVGTRFKSQVLARDGKTVFRPDSGDPVETSLEVFNLLEEHFGATVNEQGYRVLNPKIGMLWGDGIDIDGVEGILAAFKRNKIAASNLIVGMGGALLQKVDRDVQRFAFKSSYQVRNGEGINIYKDPVDKSKSSKRGRLALIELEDGSHTTLEEVDSAIDNDKLVTVFENGELLAKYSFAEIKERASL